MRALFDRLCDELERATRLARLPVRGAVRLALREAGLEPTTLNAPQLEALLRTLLPHHLARIGVADPDTVCASIGPAVAEAAAGLTAAAAPEDLFRRIRGR
jgi:hypothetical protein